MKEQDDFADSHDQVRVRSTIDHCVSAARKNSENILMGISYVLRRF